jgi:hypothetical protein
MSAYCEQVFDHSPFYICPECYLQCDRYGNTEQDYREFCSFPDCGCDGQRLCNAKSGANADSVKCNVEGMYRRRDSKAVRAKLALVGLVIERSKEQ